MVKGEMLPLLVKRAPVFKFHTKAYRMLEIPSHLLHFILPTKAPAVSACKAVIRLMDVFPFKRFRKHIFAAKKWQTRKQKSEKAEGKEKMQR